MLLSIEKKITRVPQIATTALIYRQFSSRIKVLVKKKQRHCIAVSRTDEHTSDDFFSLGFFLWTGLSGTRRTPSDYADVLSRLLNRSCDTIRYEMTR